jgi:RimJ/RimL family protein N-acetyltransferase
VTLRVARREDHPAIRAAIGSWWGDRDLTPLFGSLFLENFASSSVVSEDESGDMNGFIVGFPSLDDATAAYVHFIGVRPDARASGLGRVLHDAFAERMAERGAGTVRCVTSPQNSASVAFHQRIGFTIEFQDDELVHFVRDSVAAPFAARIDPRPGDPPWPTADWPVPESTVLARGGIELCLAASDDAAELFEALDDDAVWAHVRGRPSSADGMRTSLESARGNGRLPWIVRRDGRVVGTTSYLEVSPVDARIEIGFTLYARSEWGSDLNPTCKLLLMRWAFDHGFGRVQLKTDIRNVRSQQAIARLGASFEGVLRRYQRRQDDSVRDTVLFSVTAEEWPRVRAGLEARLDGTGSLN